MDWVMAHPWMTFFIICLFIIMIDNCVGNVIKYKALKYEKQNEKVEDE